MILDSGVVAPDLSGQFDPCYHLACDSYGINGYPDNINDTVLSEMSGRGRAFRADIRADDVSRERQRQGVKPYDWKGDHLVR